jgi:hypothetical protein
VQANRKWLAVLSALVLANLVLAGVLYVRLSARAPDPMASRPGFSAAMLQVPAFPQGDPNLWEERPGEKARFPPGYAMEAAWSTGEAFAGWGGHLRGWLKNTGTNDLFVYGIAVAGGWGPDTCATVGVTVKPGEKRYLGLVHFQGPASPGNHSLVFKTGILAEAGPRAIVRGFWDYGYVGNEGKPLEFKAGVEPKKYKERTNPAHYFDKANRLVDRNDPAVAEKAKEIQARFPGPFSLHQAAAAFDFVHQNITYKAEAPGMDYWQSPAETLVLSTGDCEDYTLLLGALVAAMGGTARLHIETDHAFLSVFVGPDLQAATHSLSLYYNTDLRTAAFSDQNGQWLVADATDSEFPGALPLGGEPLTTGGWGLTNTTVHYPVDLLPD